MILRTKRTVMDEKKDWLEIANTPTTKSRKEFGIHREFLRFGGMLPEDVESIDLKKINDRSQIVCLIKYFCQSGKNVKLFSRLGRIGISNNLMDVELEEDKFALRSKEFGSTLSKKMLGHDLVKLEVEGHVSITP